MEVVELVSVYLTALLDEEYCKGKESESSNWEAKINKCGSRQGCSGTALYKNMETDKEKEQGYLAPPVAFVAKNPGKAWNLRDIKKTQFPIQAHHLIPKNHLPDHPVCAFLAKDYTKHEDYQLTADAPYSCDHANNGYCLPYATPLAEWKKAATLPADERDDRKLDLCFKVMKKTGRQLHQGSHRADPYDGPIDDDEEATIHGKYGYLEAVDLLLSVVQEGAQEHTEKCEICNKGKTRNGKTKIQPVQAVVRHVDQVSGILKLQIDGNQIFVSEPAASCRGRMVADIDLPDWIGENS
jgi:hypothetical protein